MARKSTNRPAPDLGIAVRNVLVSVGPRKVVIGGGVAAAGDMLLDPIRRTIRERVTIMPVEPGGSGAPPAWGKRRCHRCASWAAQNLPGSPAFPPG